MFPMKKRLAIQEPPWRSICMGSPGLAPSIILGMATLVKDIQPPTTVAQRDTAMAETTWLEGSHNELGEVARRRLDSLS